MNMPLEDLPAHVRSVLVDFIDDAKIAFAANLTSVVLFGSAAEGRLRATSDVNLMLILSEINFAQVNEICEKLRFAHAAVQLNVMFLTESEIPLAAEAFAVKFTDVLHRHRILFGADVFKSLSIPRDATLFRLRQVIINLKLRLREKYALQSLREEQLVELVAESSAPIRACAATILLLQERPASSPKEALQKLLPELRRKDWSEVLKNISKAREERVLNAGEAASTLLGLLEILQALQEYVQEMR